MTFHDFNFNEQLAEGLDSMGFKNPTPIQQLAIPVVLQGKDVIACAQTGTGKTASYLLPLLNLIAKDQIPNTTALILAPTRELAQQIDQQAEGLAYFTGLSSVAVFGGGDGIIYEQQRRAIQNGVDIVIATPGRLMAHLNSGVLKFNHLRYLILDEADRMLDMGFQDDIMRIVAQLPKKRQTLLFSATMPPKIRKLAHTIMHEPEQINIAVSQPAAGINQQVYRVHDDQKGQLIRRILGSGQYTSSIVFASTKEKVKAVYKDLRSAHFNVKAFHSDMTQLEREEILLAFKNRQLPTIIGTDALSRGIDVEGIDLVINYDAPHDPEDYIHRIGRTARAATTGTAITFINRQDNRKLQNIQQLIEKPIAEIPLPEDIAAIPVHDKPASGSPHKRRKHPHHKHKGKGKHKQPAGAAAPPQAKEG